MEAWNKIEYQVIKEAKLDKGKLAVTFENGDVAEVPLVAVLSSFPEDSIKSLTNHDLEVNPYDIEIKINGEARLIPWDKIRVLSDKSYSKFMSDQAEEQAKLVGIKIKRLREKKGLRANDLSERSGITAQTISRIEKGHQDISFITLRKLLAAMGYSLKDLANEEVELANEQKPVKTLAYLLKRLSKIGIDPGFVTKRIIPRSLQIQLSNSLEQPDILVNEAAAYVSNIYGWKANDIWDNTDLSVDTFNNVLFKKGARGNANLISAYMPYAEFLAKSTLKAVRKKKTIGYPDDIEQFKAILNERYGGLTFPGLLSYSWDMGICVIPLNDSGIFHGAAWNINGSHVILLKQQVTSHARWIFDLLHELYHVFQHLDSPESMIVESEEISPTTRNDDTKELEANSFASQVIFNGSPEPFAQEAVELAKGKVELLKWAVQEVSQKHGLRTDSLANYLAHRLAYQGSQWWQTADTLQEKEPFPYEIARDILLENIDMNKLGPIDYNILSTATKTLSEP